MTEINKTIEDILLTPLPLELLKTFNHLSPYDIDGILEWLNDHNAMSHEGFHIMREFWEMFIKQEK